MVGAAIPIDDGHLFVITENGIAKSTPLLEYPLQGRAGTGVNTMKLPLGERIAAVQISTLDDLVVILTSKRFKLIKFRAAPNGGRSIKGDYAISLSGKEKVLGLTQIVQRPTIAPRSAPPSPNGSNGAHEPQA
ncbi:MAG TPA: DNA gyrase C-terminal beta-propeller domain-containing protein [Aggregatilineales bacterium]|nr:DNA gyrase C-terminal beta-propeller domain-containing protein [Aggregatilineales bacterium]